MVNVEIDKKSYQRASKRLAHIPKGINIATKNAINRTITSTNRLLYDDLKSTYTVKLGEVKHGIEKKNATLSKLSGEVSATGPVLRVSGFKNNTATPKSYTVSIKKAGKKNLPEQVFVAKMSKNSGKQKRQHSGIFIRKGDERLGIRELTGPSIAGMANSKHIMPKVKKAMYKKFNERFDHEVKRLLEKG
ncbi:MAG: hypothetical protein AB9856_03550 [Cellulosilyticaceae bacterium]